MSYAPHEAFVAPARPKSELWRTFAAFLAAAAIYIGGLGVTFALMGAVGANGLLAPIEDQASTAGTLFLLGTFVWMGVGIVAAAYLFTGRGFTSLLGNRSRLRRDFEVTAIVTLVASLAAGLLFFWLIDTDPNLPMGRWLLILPLALPLVLLQTGAEELVFRGFLQQQLAARFARPLIWMIGPAALFGIAHFDQATQGNNAIGFVLATGLFGLIAADLTARTGSLGAAWGLHFANNVMAILITSYPGPLGGLSLHILTTQPDDPSLLPLLAFDMGLMTLIWAIARRFLSR